MAFQFEKDLIRHTLTHSEDPNVRKYKCPSRACDYASKGFKRKDHFTRHVRAQHGMVGGHFCRERYGIVVVDVMTGSCTLFGTV